MTRPCGCVLKGLCVCASVCFRLLLVPLQLCGMMLCEAGESRLQGLDQGQSGLELLAVTPHPLLHLHLDTSTITSTITIISTISTTIIIITLYAIITHNAVTPLDIYAVMTSVSLTSTCLAASRRILVSSETEKEE